MSGALPRGRSTAHHRQFHRARVDSGLAVHLRSFSDSDGIGAPMARTRLLGLSLSAAAVLLMAAATQAFAAPPTVTSISPSSGSTSGQTLFCPSLTSTTITGTNFTGATSATIGGTQAAGILV